MSDLMMINEILDNNNTEYDIHYGNLTIITTDEYEYIFDENENLIEKNLI